MSKHFKLLPSLFFLSFLLIQTAKAQTGIDVGIGVGAFVYQGDLAPFRIGSIYTTSPGFQLTVAKPVLPYLSLRAGFAYTNLKGDETKYGPEFRKFRAFKFSNQVKELSVVAQFKFLSLNTDRKFEPYVIAGAGLGFTKLTRDYSGFRSEYFSAVENYPARIAADSAVTPKSPMLIIPLGIGVQYHLTDNIAISLEGNYRLTRNDYVDGFSIAAKPDNNDHYTSAVASVIYSFSKKGKGMGCPSNVR